MKLTIDKKVCLIISLAIFVFGTLIGIYIVRDETEHMGRVLDERAYVLLNNLAYNLAYPAMVRDTEAISRLVKGVMAQKDVVYCRVVGRDGLLLYQEKKKGGDAVREFTVPVVAKKAGEEESLILGASREVTEEVGKVVLAVSLSELNDKRSQLRSTITTVVTAIIFMVSLGTYILLRRLVGRPVEQLVHATERIARGDLAHKVSLTTKDEFEILGDSFDRMTEKLRDTQEELLRREKLSVLGQLAGGVGNELRNPLGVMRNSVFFLKDVLSDADEGVREYLEIINSEIDNSHRIISDFIDFFRTKKSQPKVLEIRQIISQSVELVSIPVDVSLQVELPDDLPLVHIDPSQMRQVFRNLITNAVQAMPDGGSLRIAARKVSRKEQGSGKREAGSDLVSKNIPDVPTTEMDFVEISITDTGTGIAPENMERVFQPLFSTKSRGIGLGLAICKSFVEANAGRIEAESELGKGTTFTVVLPVEI